MNKLRDSLSLIVVLLFGLIPAYAIAAQDLVATPNPDSAPMGVLAEFDIRMLPGPHAEVWFIRAQLEPEGRLPLGVQTGQTVFYVETGSLTVEAEGLVISADAELVDATAAEPITLDSGGSLMLTRDSEATLTNTFGDPTIFLMLVMYAAVDEGQGDEEIEQPVGLTQAGVSIGTAEFMPGPATLVMERVVVEPGDTMQNVTLSADGNNAGPGWGGIDLGTIETGSADLTFEQRSFQNMIWPPMSPEQFSPPEQVLLTGTARVEQGEAYAGFNSVISFTNTGEEPLTILRVIVTPHMGP